MLDTARQGYQSFHSSFQLSHLQGQTCVCRDVVLPDSLPMSRKRSKAADGDPAVSEGALANDVAAYAAEIGLAPEDQSGRGFDDSDFRPELANVRIGEHVKNEDLEVDKSKQVALKKRSKNKFKPDAEPDEPARPPAAVTERTWNEGAGSRPGMCLFMAPS